MFTTTDCPKRHIQHGMTVGFCLDSVVVVWAGKKQWKGECVEELATEEFSHVPTDPTIQGTREEPTWSKTPHTSRAAVLVVLATS